MVSASMLVKRCINFRALATEVTNYSNTLDMMEYFVCKFRWRATAIILDKTIIVTNGYWSSTRTEFVANITMPSSSLYSLEVTILSNVIDLNGLIDLVTWCLPRRFWL